MDNHQAELGDHLAAQRVLACATPDQLLQVLASFDPASCQPFERGSAAGIVARIDQLMGRRQQE
jgi:UDP-N-acetylglucosamine transferase subunit ALG13